MAAVLKLTFDTESLSFLDNSGLYLEDDGWIPKVADVVSGRPVDTVTETLTMYMTATDQNDVATQMQLLDLYRWRASEYMANSTLSFPVNLNASLENETGERAALVHEIKVEWLSQHYSGEMIGSKPRIRLTIVRGGAWEELLANQESAATGHPSAAASVYWDHTDAGGGGQDVVGDIPARIVHLRLDSNVNSLSRFWIGFRSANKQYDVITSLNNFQNIWECEDTDATLGTDAARTTDATASPGGGGDTKVRVTPGTATWAKRLTIKIGDVTSDEEDQIGVFMWLLRAAVTAGTWEVRLKWGYAYWDDDDFVEGGIKEINNTSWDYYETGVKPVPLRNLHPLPFTVMGVSLEVDYTIQVWARRTDGAGSLDLDCICPVPIDEGYVKVTNANLVINEGVYIACGPGDTFGSMGRESRSPRTLPSNFYLPVGDGRTVIVYARAGSSVLADTFDVGGFRYLLRWLALRGAE